MNKSNKIILAISAIFAIVLLSQSQAFMKPGPELRALPNYDVRLVENSATAALSPALKSDFNQALSSLKSELGHDVVAHLNEQSNTPHHLFSYNGALTEPRKGDPETIARDFLSNHSKLFANTDAELNELHTVRNYQTAHNGMTHLTFQQTYHGLEVFGAEIRANIRKDGAISSIGADHYPGITSPITNNLSAADAVVAAAKILNPDIKFVPEIKSSSIAANQKTTFASGPFAAEIPAELVVFPLCDIGKLAWKTTLAEKDTPNVYLILIDANDGSLLYRCNLTKYAAYGRVYEEDPIATTPPFGNTRVIEPFDGTAISPNPTIVSPQGWVTGTITDGNNVRAQDNWNGDYSSGQPASNPNAQFDFSIDLFQHPTTYRDASLTNLFWLVNLAHDWYYDLGFTEAAGNFQNDNFGRGGLGNDAVLAFGQDLSGTDNAWFATPPDGSAGYTAMYLWYYSSPPRDCSLDGSVVIHEYTHGLSTRLVGIYALQGPQSGGMGEGWGDWFAGTLYDDNPTNIYSKTVNAAYSYNYPGGTRRYPYSTDMNINPLTYGDMAWEVHDNGEIWCVTLWEMYKLFVQRYGIGDNTTEPWRVEEPYDGRERAWFLVVDAMKLSPTSPTMLDMRDAILEADQNDFDGADSDIIWQAFAKRGMGYSAISFGDTGSVAEAFDIPPIAPILELVGFTIDDSQGNGDGKVDTGETILMPITLRNKGTFDAIDCTVTLSSPSPYITFTRDKITLPTIGVGSTVTSDPPYFEWYSSSTTPISYIPFNLEVKASYSTGLSYNTTAGISIPIGAYVVEKSAYSWIEPSAGTKITLGDDASTTANIGFTFNYYGNQYTSLLISSNGYFTFGQYGNAYSNSPIPNETEPNNIIAVFWDDLDPSQPAANIYYLTSGKAPNRKFTVAWENVPPFSSDTSLVGRGTFEVTLFESNGDIICQYQDVNFGNVNTDNGISATVGIENDDGTLGTQYSFNTASLNDGLALRFHILKSIVGAINIGNIPDIKLIKKQAQSDVLFLNSYLEGTTAASWTWSAGTTFANLSIDANSWVDYLTPKSSNAGMDTVTFTAAGEVSDISVLKYSTYLFSRLPEALVDNGKKVENCDINLQNYVSKASNAFYPFTYPYTVQYHDESDSTKLNVTFTGSTIHINATNTLAGTADIVVTATLVFASDWDKEFIHVSELLDCYGEFSSARDTTQYWFELPLYGATSLPTISWVSSVNGQNGVLQLNFSTALQGVKVTSQNEFEIKPLTWYTMRSRFASNASVGNLHQLSGVLFVTDTVTGTEEQAGFARQPGQMFNSTWWEQQTYFYNSSNKVLRIRPMVVFKNNGSSGSMYLDYIRVYESKPQIERAVGSLSSIRLPNGSFDSDVSGWFYDYPIQGVNPTTPLPWYGVYPSVFGQTNAIAIGFAQDLQGIKLTSDPVVNIAPMKSLKLSWKAYGGVANSGRLIAGRIYCIDTADAQKRSDVLGPSGISAQMPSGKWITYTAVGTPLLNSETQARAQIVVKNGNVANDAVYLDDITLEQENDSPYFWDHTLF